MKKVFEYATYTLAILAFASVGLIVYSIFTGNVLTFVLCVLYLIFFIFGESRLDILTRLWHKAGKRCWWENEPQANQ